MLQQKRTELPGRFAGARKTRVVVAESGGLGAHAILDVIGAGVLAVRADGVVTRANPTASRILRRALSDLEGHAIDDIIAPIDELLARAGESVAQSGIRKRGTRAESERSRTEIWVQHADGTMIALGFSVSTVQDLEKGVHHVLLFQEIAPLLELRKERDRLLQIAVIGEVMPTLLHEIRNPLAAVTAMLEVLVEDASPELQTDLHAILSEVRRITLGLQGIGGLVRTLHSHTYCAVDRAVRESCRLLEQAATRRAVVLTSEGPDLPLLPMDRGAICGVVFNLVKNAVDACPNGGHVNVNARLEGDDLVLSVRDDGIGMSPELVDRCRELFFTTKDTGSGIGLALCTHITEASGGTLRIESAVGEGTRVVVRVPTRAPAAAIGS